MSDTASFDYEGNAVFNISGGHAKNTPKAGDIEILSVQHLIPIKVSLKIDGEETVVGAYVDYTDKSVTVPSNELASVNITEAAFSQAVQQYLSDRVERQMAEAEAQQTRIAQDNFRQAQAAQARAFAAAHAVMESEDE